MNDRSRALNDRPVEDGPVLYIMSRDQRVEDNWALLYAQAQALKRKKSLCVLFNLLPHYPHPFTRHFDFLLRGLEEVAEKLEKLQIGFQLTVGDAKEEITKFVQKEKVGLVVFDVNPLRSPTRVREAVAASLPVHCREVDAHNIVPVWEASAKAEFSARTFRPKINAKLGAFLTDFPRLKKHPQVPPTFSPTKWQMLRDALSLDDSVSLPAWITPGSRAGQAVLRDFVTKRLTGYADDRNDPNKAALSNLSPYLHYGQVSAARVALEVKQTRAPESDKEALLEELIVRRELADNFCFYTPHYDLLQGAHSWAQKTLAAHADDQRSHFYSRTEFEKAKTHDALWNAMQRQMVIEGKMHGWCRMYWAKKILEWTPNIQCAIDTALYLNDKYELDGRDPNGVVGVMWSMCGVHDRAWAERPVFGKIRYMNYNGATRKFDVAAYIARYGSFTENIT